MAPPVWVLSVDLQTKTATFQSGLADAARSARGAFGDIKSSGGEMGESIRGSMGESEHSVMALAELFGGHMPRMIAAFISSIGPLGATLEAAFPFLAIALGAALLIEKLAKMHEEGEKLTEDQNKFQVATMNAFNTLQDKLLQAQIRSDELRKNHLGALHKELELIDHQTLNDLVQSFQEVEKTALEVLNGLQAKWYEFGVHTAGAKNALVEFNREYTLLLDKHTAEGASAASGLLSGTLAQAKKVQELQKEAIATKPVESWTGGKDYEKTTQYNRLINELKQYGSGISQKDVEAQNQLVEAYENQVRNQQELARIKAQEGSNAKTTTGQTINDERNKHADGVLKYNEAINRMMDDDNKQSNADLELREREAIEITQEGSNGKLAAINSAMQEEQAYGRQGTSFYAALLGQRVELIRKMTQEQGKLQADAGKEAADNDVKMGELEIAALKQFFSLRDSSLRASVAREIAEQTQLADTEYALKEAALQRELAALDTGSNEYANKLKALQDKEKQLVQAHENEVTAIRERAEIERNQRVLSSFNQMQDAVARGLTQSIMGHETWSRMVLQFADQAASGFINESLRIMMGQDKERLGAARTAATNAYASISAIPIVGPFLAPEMAAAAFAGSLAFAGGGIVPGVGNGDIVPAMLTPGETVLPKAMTEMLSKAAQRGDGGGGQHVTVHVHHRPTINALDAEGMDRALHKHTDLIAKHVANRVRRQNRG